MREDLRYRLEVIPIALPPLRDRKSDIELLFKRFLNRVKTQRWSITGRALHLLKTFPWPGNIRQLENVAMFAATMCETDTIDIDMLPDELQKFMMASSVENENVSSIRRETKPKDMSRDNLEGLLESHKNNKVKSLKNWALAA